jgi:hypothetical protein
VTPRGVAAALLRSGKVVTPLGTFYLHVRKAHRLKLPNGRWFTLRACRALVFMPSAALARRLHLSKR